MPREVHCSRAESQTELDGKREAVPPYTKPMCASGCVTSSFASFVGHDRDK